MRFHWEEQGLAGTPSFVYSTEYACRVLEGHQDLESQEVIGKSAVGVNLPCSFNGDYYEGEVAPVLRDIIPQGASRRLWLKRLGHDRDREKAIDVRLLAEDCIAPIGNLRIKEAAEAFQQKLVGMTPSLFSAEEIGTNADRLFEYTQQVGIASGGALGAGDDAPKLLLVENHQGQFALEGTIPESQIHQHWLVKLPRGRKTQRDRDVLKGEAVIYNALEGTAVESIPNASLQQVDGQLALWLPRFDREIKGGAVPDC